MRVIWLILSICIAIALEVYAWSDLIFHSDEDIFINIFLVHLLSSVIAACGCLFVKIDYNDHKMKWFTVFFVMILLMPGFGLLGVYISMLHALLYPKKKSDVFWANISVPDLPYKPVIVGAHPTYGEGGLSSVIQSAKDVHPRLNAVIAARQINDKMAIPLLQEALKDPEDDVRLFAYAALDAKTTGITDRIADLLRQSEQQEGLAKARFCYALAQNYWELSFLGLATGNTLDFVLNEAERFANQAAGLGWAGSDIEFLIGRIFLYQKRYVEAQNYFNASLENGALESAILPFLAEIAYETHDSVGVRDILKRLEISCDGNSPIPAIVKSWSIA